MTSQELALKITGDAKGASAAASEIVTALQGVATQVDATQGALSGLATALKSPLEFAKGVFEGMRDEFKGIPVSAQESTAQTSLTFRDMWDNITAKSYNSIADLGSAVQDGGKSIGDALTHPLEAVKGLINGVLEALGPFGAGLAAIGAAAMAAGVALFELASKAAEIGDNIGDMGAKMSLSVESTSRLAYAMNIAGGSVEQASNVVFMMQMRLNSGGESAEHFEAALAGIGIEATAFKAMQADQQLYAVAKAFQANTNETNRATTAMALFGRQGRDMIPLLMKDLEGLAGETHKVWSAEETAAAEEFNMKLAALKDRFAQISVEVGSALIPTFTVLVKVLDRTIVGLGHIIDLGGLVSGSYRALKGVLGETALAAETAAARQDVINNALKMGAPAGISFAEALKIVNGELDDNKAAAVSAAAAISEWTKKIDEQYQKQQKQKALNDALRDRPGTLPGRTFDFEGDEARLQKAKAAAEEYEKTVRSLARALSGQTDNLSENVEAIRRVIAAGISDEDVKERVLDAINKMKRAHQQLAPDLQKFLDTNIAIVKTLATVGGGMSQMTLVVTGLRKNFASMSEGEVAELEESLGNLTSYTNQFNGGMTVAGDTLNSVTIPAFTKLIEGAKGLPVAMEDGVHRTGSALANLSDSFVKMGQISGGALGSVLAGIGQVVVGLEAAQVATQQQGANGQAIGGKFGVGSVLMSRGINAASGSQKMAAGVQGAAGILGGIGELDDATSSHASAGGNALGGAAAGAKMGAAFGPWGMAIGAAAGLVVGLIRGKPEWAKAADDVGRDFGVKISDGLAKAIAETEKTEHVGRYEASLMHLKDVIAEAGGLNEKNLQKLMGNLHDVFSKIETHTLSVAQGQKIIEENWDDFAKAGTDASGRISQGLKDIITLNDRFGTDAKAIGQWVLGQTDTMTSGFNAVALALEGDIDSLASLGTQAVSTFATMVAAGKSEAEALKAVGPGLASLQKSYKDLGIDITDVGLSALVMQSTINDGNPTLMAGVAGLASGMVAMDNIGLMNIGTFQGMETSGMQMYIRLQSQVAAVGGTTRDALVPMQAYLRQAEIEAKSLGTNLDGNTTELIRQSKELGVWKDVGKSANEALLDGMTRLVDKVSELVDHLNGVTSAINNIPSSKTITFDYQSNGDFPYAQTDPNLQSFDHRPLERVTSAGFALLHPGDVVGVPKPGMLGGGGGNTTVYVTVEGNVSTERDLAKALSQLIADDFQQVGGLMPLN